MDEKTVIISAVVVFVVWGFRYLDEMNKPHAENHEKGGVNELIGLSPEPAHPAQFLVAYGFIFFVLSLLATGAPKAAGAFALLVAVGTTIANGYSLFNDINQAVAGTTLVETPKPAIVTEHKESQKNRHHA